MFRRWLAVGFVVTVCLSAVPFLPAPAAGEIKISIPTPPLPPLPPLVFPRLPDPRDLIPIPNVGAFFVPDIDVEIVFSNGYWWTQRDGRWCRSREYRGPYVFVPPGVVPPYLSRLPRDYRHEYRKGKRIPYGQWKKRHYREEQRGRGDRYDEHHYRDRGRGDYREDHGRGGKGHDRGRGKGH